MESAKDVFTTDLYYKAIEGSDSGLWVYDLLKDFCYLSNRYYIMLGYEPGEFQGTMENLFSLLHPEDLEKTNKAFAEFFQAKSLIYRNEVRLKTKSGAYLDILTQGLGERDAEGKLNKFIGWNIDISSLKEAQRKLDEERALNIAQSKLAQLGIMAGGLAHEINNPLTIVQMRSELISRHLKQGNFDPKMIQEGLHEIQQAAKRVSEIIGGLRTMADGSSKESKRKISVIHIIQEVITICRSEITKRGINLHFEPSGLDSIIEANFALMCQVLLNLIYNSADAVESTPEKDIWIKLDSDESHCCIIVQDNGIGVNKDDQEKIMVPFFTTKEPGKGTGLGLTISKSIIQSEKGDLYFEQQEKLTKFVIKLPLA